MSHTGFHMTFLMRSEASLSCRIWLCAAQSLGAPINLNLVEACRILYIFVDGVV